MNDTKVKLDMVADFNGEKVLVEVKNGPSAHFTHNQNIVYPKMSASSSVLPEGLSIKEFLSLQNSFHPTAPITPVGNNAYSIWPQGTTITDYKFIIIRF